MELNDWLKVNQMHKLDEIIQGMTNPKVLLINHDHKYTSNAHHSWEWITKALARRLYEDLEVQKNFEIKGN